MMIILTDSVRGGIVIRVHGVRIVTSESINLQFRRKNLEGNETVEQLFYILII